jgi:hypothetical protein
VEVVGRTQAHRIDEARLQELGGGSESRTVAREGRGDVALEVGYRRDLDAGKRPVNAEVLASNCAEPDNANS